MMAAAQAAAEAALREALAKESEHERHDISQQQFHQQLQQQQQHQQQHQQQQVGGSGIMDVAMNAAIQGMEGLDQSVLEQDEMRLMRALQAAEADGQMNVLQDLLQGNASGVDGGSVQTALLQMLARQEQEQLASLKKKAISSVPEEHYLTVAQNGTILEATKMATGIPADALLMSSAYDNVYDEDLPGFLCVKTKIWDQGVAEVPVYIRRRNVEGEWFWLESKAVSYVSQPVPGIILHERKVKDENLAIELNRITRITAIVVQAVEAAKLSAARRLNVGDNKNEESKREELLANLDEDLRRKVVERLNSTDLFTAKRKVEKFDNLYSKIEEEMIEKVVEEIEQAERGHDDKEKESTFDPFSIMESVREGVRLDLGLTRLSKSEVTMIVLILAGRLPVDDLVPLVLHAVQKGQDIESVLAPFQPQSNRKRSLSSTSSQRFHSKSPRGSSYKSHNQLLKGERRILSEPIAAPTHVPPPISVLNLSYTYIGNRGMEILSEVLYIENSALATVDISFCCIDERGFIAFSKGLIKRRQKGMPCLKGLILSGNHISSRSATELGIALNPFSGKRKRRSRGRGFRRNTGYDGEGSESDDEDDDDESDDEDVDLNSRKKFPKPPKPPGGDKEEESVHTGLQVLHVSCASLTAEAMSQLLHRIGPLSPVRELNLSSNNMGPTGASILVDFLQGKSGIKPKSFGSKTAVVMPHLDRLDLSNNNLGDDGTSRLTSAIAKRSKANFVELRLALNNITAGGIETMMNKLLQHNLVSLSLDKNAIGDQGCQLVAASLQTMKLLSRLSLGFNQIGSRGASSLMRSLVACESITFLELSGNVLKMPGAVALAFTLAQHPRLEELDLDDCCLGQAAQCHIVAGIISNRWVPMKRLNGFSVGPPMVEIGALEPYAQSFSNEKCFRIRKDEQMKTILQWMESNRAAKQKGPHAGRGMGVPDGNHFLTPDFVTSMNEVSGTPSQNAYLRLLGWLSRIPFDEDELSSLQKYFYDIEGGDGERGSDGYINLKQRGDLLAALDSDVADDIRDEIPIFEGCIKRSVGLDLEHLDAQRTSPNVSNWRVLLGDFSEKMPELSSTYEIIQEVEDDERMGEPQYGDQRYRGMESSHNLSIPMQESGRQGSYYVGPNLSTVSVRSGLSTASSIHASGHGALCGKNSESDATCASSSSQTRKGGGKKARITMFPMFQQKLEELKATAAEMIELEEDPDQQEVILTQYAEASLTILRQLRYHCMNSGLDGWRHGGLKRKVLIVDDSNMTRKLVSRAFEKANFIVDTASNGAEGVEKLKKSIYDIAFMDIDMPVMDGFEATKKLRQWEDACRPGARQPICALTAAYVDDFERSQLMKFKEAGLDVMESKPCNIPRLFKVVDDVSPMFSDLSISVIQRENSNASMHKTS